MILFTNESHFTFLQGSMSCLSLSVQPPVECSMAPRPFQTLKSKQNIKIVKNTQNKRLSVCNSNAKDTP